MFDRAGLRSSPFRQGSLRQYGPGGSDVRQAVIFSPDFDFSIAVENGTSMMPWVSSALIQMPIRSIEIGNAEAMPTAVPRSFARFSSFARVRSISTDVGTASILKSALAKGIAWPAASDEATLRGAEPSSR